MWKNGTVELRQDELEILSADLGEKSCLPDLLGESILQNNLKFNLGEEDEIFEGYGRVPNAFPYRQFNAYGETLKPKKVKTMVLENRHLTAVFLPEFGGRLWSLTDRRTGKDLLYTNDVLQFRNLAVRNAWFSGGVEWNIGIIGHSPFTTAPLYVAVLHDDDGNPVLRMYEYERIRNVFYQMDFWLAEDDEVLNCRMRIINEAETVVPMYWWSNMATPEHENGRIIVPAKAAYTTSEKGVIKTDIPMVNGIDITRYNDIPNSIDYFFELDKAAPKYIANVDADGFGLLQMSTSRLQSRKLFSWGHQDGSKHWQELLTKDAGDYIEIQAGLGKTQYGCIPMPPHTAWEWMEQYGAVQLPEDQLGKSNEETSTLLTEKLLSEGRAAALEQKLVDTKPLAKKTAEIIMTGSSYGAFVSQHAGTEHLQFIQESESLEKWSSFKCTGRLHEPDPHCRPDEFFMDDETFDLLKETVHSKNKKNWYAHYQLGLGFYIRKDYKSAKQALKTSYELKKNPWVCHALSCIYIKKDKKAKAAHWMLKGLDLEHKDISYLKEAFRILHWCEAYKEIDYTFNKLDKTEQRIPRLRFYDLSAKYHLGKYQDAFDMLESEEGLTLEDVREGEASLETLWIDLNEALTGERTDAPHRYTFRASK